MRSVLPFVVLLALSTGCVHHRHHQCHPGSNSSMQTGISVSGSGEATTKPDIAKANLGVEVRAATVEQANADADQRMTAVINALKQAGIAASDLRTNNYSINFEQEPVPVPVPVPAPAPAPTRSKGKVAAEAKAAAEAKVAPPELSPVPRGYYRVSNMVEVKIRNLTTLGRVLAAATAAGANNVWGISFELDDPYALRAKARAQAMQRAQQSAAELARLAGVKLGDVIAVSESDGGGYAPMFKHAASADMAQSNAVPVEQGEITVSHTVQLTYALDDDHDSD